jgi:hypothetical protein
MTTTSDIGCRTQRSDFGLAVFLCRTVRCENHRGLVKLGNVVAKLGGTDGRITSTALGTLQEAEVTFDRFRPLYCRRPQAKRISRRLAVCGEPVRRLMARIEPVPRSRLSWVAIRRQKHKPVAATKLLAPPAQIVYPSATYDLKPRADGVSAKRNSTENEPICKQGDPSNAERLCAVRRSCAGPRYHVGAPCDRSVR